MRVVIPSLLVVLAGTAAADSYVERPYVNRPLLLPDNAFEAEASVTRTMDVFESVWWDTYTSATTARYAGAGAELELGTDFFLDTDYALVYDDNPLQRIHAGIHAGFAGDSAVGLEVGYLDPGTDHEMYDVALGVATKQHLHPRVAVEVSLTPGITRGDGYSMSRVVGAATGYYQLGPAIAADIHMRLGAYDPPAEDRPMFPEAGWQTKKSFGFGAVVLLWKNLDLTLDYDRTGRYNALTAGLAWRRF